MALGDSILEELCNKYLLLGGVGVTALLLHIEWLQQRDKEVLLRRDTDLVDKVLHLLVYDFYVLLILQSLHQLLELQVYRNLWTTINIIHLIKIKDIGEILLFEETIRVLIM